MWDALVGRKAKGDYYDPHTWEVFLRVGEVMDQAIVDRLDVWGLAAAEAGLQGLSVGDEGLGRWTGWGRYKSAIARAVLRPGSGELRVNGQPVWEYFKGAPNKAKSFLRRLLEMVMVKQVLMRMEVIVRVEGSSPVTMRQTKAVAHAIARALMSFDSKHRKPLRQAGFGGVRLKSDERS